MTKFQQHLPRKVEFARDAIVTMIHDRNLGKGERLPSYSRMREDLGIGSQTIAAAVASLCDHGVLEVQDKVGIFVKNPDGGQLAGRTVAVAVRQLVGSSYAAMLASFIQKLLNEHNCHCLTFYQTSGENTSRRPDLKEFPGLEQAVRENNIDGIITLCPFSDRALKQLNECGIKSCFIGDDDHNVMPCGILIDVKHFILMAKSELEKSGCRKIVQFFATPEQKERRSAILAGVTGSSYSGGAAIAREFLDLPPEERPDGIISDDDTIVSGFLAELGQTDNPAYRPKIATIVHDEVGELYPSSDMLLYSQNMERYSQMAVELLLMLLQGKENDESVKYYRFKKRV